MSIEYTPNTEAVKDQYTREQPPQIGTASEKAAEFDRWHTAELRRAKAEAWRELVVRLAYFEGLDLNKHPNPYREADDDE